MPSALHPRSRTTLSLFTTTLALSFVVVGLPHLIPCPVPHRKRLSSVNEDGDELLSDKGYHYEQTKRECPVPRPTGLIGRLLGFATNQQHSKPLPMTVQKHAHINS